MDKIFLLLLIFSIIIFIIIILYLLLSKSDKEEFTEIPETNLWLPHYIDRSEHNIISDNVNNVVKHQTINHKNFLN